MKSLVKMTALIAVVAAFSWGAAWTGTKTQPGTTTVDGKTYYKITTAEHLAWFAQKVNDGSTSINGLLANDINFGTSTTTASSTNWLKIGNNSSHQFKGIFDGQNHTVYGIKLGNASEIGFFGYIGSGATVKNLVLSSSDNTTLHNKGNIIRGGIAAVNYGTISNCTNKSQVRIYAEGSSGTSYTVHVGGLVAKNYGTISDSKNTGYVASSDLTWPATGYAGGIAAYNEGTIKGCSNTATVSSNVARMNYVGGIAAQNAAKGKVQQSYNTGFVRSTYDKTYSQYSPGADNGGIVGLNAGTVENTYNTGRDSSYENTGAVYTGGIVGYNSGSSAVVKNSYAAVTRSYAKGSSSYAGGVAGANLSSGKIVNCYYDNTVLTSSKAVGTQSSATSTDVGGKATTAMKKDEFAYILNTTNKTATTSKVWSRNGGYPIFATSTYKPIDMLTLTDGDGKTGNYYTDNQGNISGVYYYIKFYNYDGSRLDSLKVAYKATPTYSKGTPVRPATAQYTYTFKGWDKTIVAATANANYTAQYNSTVNQYTVTFKGYDGTVIKTETYDYGSTIVPPAAPTRASTQQYDYTFAGWTPNTTTVVENTVLTATYDSTLVKYHLVFDAGDMHVDTLVEYGYEFELPEAPDSTGYTFNGWYDADGEKVGVSGDKLPVSGAVSLEGLYDINIYEVTFKDYDGTVIKTETYEYGSSIVPPADPTRASTQQYDYTFAGWTPNTTTVVENTVLTATYDSTLVKYHLVFDAGDMHVDTLVEYGYEFELPEAPDSTGYTFNGWYDADGEKVGFAGDKLPVSGAVSLEGRYDINSYEVAFKDYDGTEIKTESYEYGSTIVPPAEPARESTQQYDYTFAGWTPNKTTVVGNTVLTATYDSTLVKYHLVFDAGDMHVDTLVEYGFKFRLPEAPDSTGYTFDGWYDANGNKVGNAGDKLPVRGAVSLAAAYKEEKVERISYRSQMSLLVSVENGSVQIAGASVGVPYVLFDMQGRVVMKGRAPSANFNIPVAHAGNYIVRIGNKSQKVRIR